MSIYFHEQLYRSMTVMSRLRQQPVVIGGAGSLGSNIAENLARSGWGQLTVIDRDRIEQRNLSTQPYYQSDVGAFKAKILANSLYRAIGIPIATDTRELTADNTPQLLGNQAWLIDTFDNSVARRAVAEHCRRTGQPCLHVGLAADYAEVIWDPLYRVPSEAQDDICDYPLARNLVLLAVAVACESLTHFLMTNEASSYTITLRDLSVHPLEAGSSVD
ncbi:MAG: ThiF family adenylyltransferase [Cyanobacteriota bacterium]|nr:ThiF family adenylyltransferase [Cyanobacteriota bacterium]